jgi:hypothetical protein
MSPESQKDVVKVRFQDPSSQITETLWATRIESNLYQLDNSPFFAYTVSWQDIIEARVGSDDILEYVRCVKKSGNRTLRVIFQDYPSTDPKAEEILAELCDLGCTYEGMPPRLISLNVPPKVNLGIVTDFLKRQYGLQWEYADPTYEQVTGRIN